jgi:hypothetical protein
LRKETCIRNTNKRLGVHNQGKARSATIL